VPIDTAWLPMPLHHQAIQGGHQDARLRFYVHIGTELTRLDASTQQLAQGGDTACLLLSLPLSQGRGYCLFR